MSLTELLSTIQTLSRTEKIRLMRLLLDEIAREEEKAAPPLATDQHVWSPYDAHEAAAALLEVLHKDQQEQS